MTIAMHDTVAALEALHRECPDDLTLSLRLWSALERDGIQSGPRAVRVFRAAAQTTQGALSLAEAFKGLLNKTGELPRPELFDEALRSALKETLPQLNATERVEIEWLLSFLPQPRGAG